MPAFNEVLREGLRYKSTWPRVVELNGLFIENQLILWVNRLERWVPPIAVLIMAFQLNSNQENALSMAFVQALLLLSLPVQGWYWLGMRATTPLPPSLASWYQQIAQRMEEHGVHLPSRSQRLCYIDLAQLLQTAHRQLEKSFNRIIPM